MIKTKTTRMASLIGLGGPVLCVIAVIVLLTLAISGTVPWWAPLIAFLMIFPLFITGGVMVFRESRRQIAAQKEAMQTSLESELRQRLQGYRPQYGEMRDE